MVFRSQYVCTPRDPEGRLHLTGRDTRDRVYLADYTMCHVSEHIADK